MTSKATENKKGCPKHNGAAFLVSTTKAEINVLSFGGTVVLVRNGEFLATFSATCSQYATAIGGSHSFTETVFVLSFSVRRLECSFHCYILFMLLANNRLIRAAKIETFFKLTKKIIHFCSKLLRFFLI